MKCRNSFSAFYAEPVWPEDLLHILLLTSVEA